jgi:site-specific DNA-methyltransferase (adenine-specific)
MQSVVCNQSGDDKSASPRSMHIGSVNEVRVQDGKSFYETAMCSLVKGDSRDANLFPEPFADLIVTSPPYNVGIGYDSSNDSMDYCKYLDWSGAWLSNCLSWSKTEGRLCLNLPVDISKDGKRYPLAADVLEVAQRCGWTFRQWISWDEGNISKGCAYGSKWMPTAPNVICPDETILVLYKGAWTRSKEGRTWDLTKEEHKEWFFGRWKFHGESKKRIGHPAPYPIELPRRCIKLYSFLGDVVLDPFVGSGTTLIAAAQLGRKAVGVEISPEYCRLAHSRIEKEFGGAP